MKSVCLARPVIAAGLLALGGAASALPVTSLPAPKSIDMPVLAAPQTRGPVTFAEGVTWSSTSRASSFGDTRRHNLGENGNWSGAAGPFAALGAAEGTMTVSFDRPVRGVGALLNFAPPAGAFTLAIHDAEGRLLESSRLAFPSPCLPLPDCAPSDTENAGEFHGFIHDTTDISHFTMSDAYVVMRGLQVTMVPEPQTYVLMLAGLACLFFSIRRIRR